MKRSKPLRRVARLVSRTPMPRTSSVRSGAHRRRSTGPTAATVRLVLARATSVMGLRCEKNDELLYGERGRDWDIHHRRPRRMGGDPRPDTNKASNLLVLCRGCHDEIESHRADAYVHGWLLHDGDSPATVAVLIEHSSRWTYLTDAGEYSDQAPAVA